MADRFSSAGLMVVEPESAQLRIPPRILLLVCAEGPYRCSRNPIYLGFVITGTGIALAFNTCWMLLSLPAFRS